MGILNITPDSFSRDGMLLEGMEREAVVRKVLAKAQQMVAEGADLLDIGGESTRPSTANDPPLSAEVETERVVPVIEALAATLPSSVILSIDT
ncbi:MAG: dihydropteroate synthase, partial [Ktedonobacterales bacterium]